MWTIKVVFTHECFHYIIFNFSKNSVWCGILNLSFVKWYEIDLKIETQFHYCFSFWVSTDLFFVVVRVSGGSCHYPTHAQRRYHIMQWNSFECESFRVKSYRWIHMGHGMIWKSRFDACALVHMFKHEQNTTEISRLYFFLCQSNVMPLTK